MNRFFALFAFPLWLLATAFSLVSFELGYSLQGLFPLLKFGAALSAFFLLLFSWKSFSSLSLFLGQKEASTAFYLVLVTMLVGGSVAWHQYVFPKEKNIAKLGSCSYLIRPLLSQHKSQLFMEQLLDASHSSVSDSVVMLEALCKNSQLRLSRLEEQKVPPES